MPPRLLWRPHLRFSQVPKPGSISSRCSTFQNNRYEEGPKRNLRMSHVFWYSKSMNFCESLILSHSLSEFAQWECKIHDTLVGFRHARACEAWRVGGISGIAGPLKLKSLACWLGWFFCDLKNQGRKGWDESFFLRCPPLHAGVNTRNMRPRKPAHT